MMFLDIFFSNLLNFINFNAFKSQIDRPLDLNEMIEQIKDEYVRTIKKAAGTV